MQNDGIPFNEGALVVTSISGPNPVLQALAAGSLAVQSKFIVVGDSKSPNDFELEGCDFYSISRQETLPFAYSHLCHTKSYTRKNIGYLLAVQQGARFIVETDDDNIPRESFWEPRHPMVSGNKIDGTGWLNAYRYFSDDDIYPRGFPLEEIRNPSTFSTPRRNCGPGICNIQQGLADGNPDVDAIYRMLFRLPFEFRNERPLIVGDGLWCPFNSQNTTTFKEAYPLLYLPTYCSFRMTDIWRSFVAQRVGWTCGWNISFHAPSVYQERNEHDLLNDFADEVPGYLHNGRIARSLASLNLDSGSPAVEANIFRCYEKLIEMNLICRKEMKLLEAWLSDLKVLMN